jgi:serine/threonine kinase 32
VCIRLTLIFFFLPHAYYRDIKPDNILLDEKGHAHLTDFNIAVHYSDKKPLTAVAGSMAYMAPEVLLKKGYFSSVDWWSLGVVLFELLFGTVCGT